MNKKNNKDTDILSMIIEETRKNGATSADVILSRNNGLSLSLRNGKDESLERFDSFDLGLRVFVGKRNATLSTNDATEKNLKSIASKAIEMAKSVPEDKFSMIAPRHLINENPFDKNIDLENYDKKVGNLNDLREKAKELEESALNVSSILKSDGSDASWNNSKSLLMTSNGFFGETRKTNNSISIVLIAEKDKKMERDYDFSSKVFFDDLESPKVLGKRAAERVIKKLGPARVKTGNFPVIFSPRVARSILGHIASAINGSSVARGMSFLKDSMNERIFSKTLNIVDNPHIKKGMGSRLFDGEGIGTKEQKLIHKGVLKNWLLDISSGIQLKMETNGNAVRGISGPPSPGTSNFMILPSNYSQNDLVKSVSEGFFVTELIGSSVSLITGDYSRGAGGFWIKNGKISNPISEATIAGNLKEMFMQIKPANDLDLSYSIASPTLLVENMVVAGN